MSKPKTCFVIAPIGEEGSEPRKRSDLVFKHIIKPVTKRLGYEPEMPHHVNEPGSISTQIIERLLSADLVVADLTDHNPNVMYELAVRHVVRKPVVQLIQKGQRLPFDIAQQRTIELDHRDLDSAEEAKDKLSKQIEAVQKDPTQVDSPITVAVNLTSLKGSENPGAEALVEIMSILQEIRAEQRLLSRVASFSFALSEESKAGDEPSTVSQIIRDLAAQRERQKRESIQKIAEALTMREIRRNPHDGQAKEET